jgi:hypothetical protein
MNKTKEILTGITVLLIAILFSCSKARIEKPEIIPSVKIKFVPLTNYFANKRKSKEIFTIIEQTSPPFGLTTDYLDMKIASCYFLDPINNLKVEYPYILELTQLIKKKDLIYYNIQPTENNFLINYKAVIKFDFIKDNRLLYLKNFFIASCFYKPENYPYTLSDDYLGTMNNNIINWEYQASSSNYINHLSWTLYGRLAEFQTTNYTKLNFISNKYDLTNVGIYIVFSDKNTFTRVQNQESINLPVGEQAKLVAFGITEKGKLYSYSKEIIIGEETSYSIDLTTTNDAFLTSMLDSL